MSNTNIPLHIQYSKAEKLSTFINLIVENCLIDREDYFNKMFNLYTCEAEGLDRWGSLLGQTRYYHSAFVNNAIAYTAKPNYLPYPNKTDVRPYNVAGRSYDGIGVYYDNTTRTTALTDMEYRILLINAYKLQYTACTLGRLNDYLYNFFKVIPYDVTKNPNYNLQWEVEITNLPSGRELWLIKHHGPFINEIGISSQNWKLLFDFKTESGRSRIMPIPIDAQWEVQQV